MRNLSQQYYFETAIDNVVNNRSHNEQMVQEAFMYIKEYHNWEENYDALLSP